MYIQVQIPYERAGLLAKAYNRALEDGTSEWVLFLDHDVFLSCNPLWYDMCLHAIGQLKNDPKAACVTCMCGGERHLGNLKRSPDIPDSIYYHIQIAKKRFKEHRFKLEQLNEYAAGFFLLLNREIAREIGFRQVKSSINNIDQDFGDRLLEAGYHIYRMKGLYVYHRRRIKHLIKEFRK